MKKIILISIFSIFLYSCSPKVAFTSDIQNKYGFSESTLKKVQFYTSKEIVLYKSKEDDNNVAINNGKLYLTNFKDAERIIIKKGTPCVLEQIIDEKHYLFSFEYGNNKVIVFGNNGNGYFSLMAKEWNSGRGSLTYSGKNYLTYNGDAYLKVKIKKLTHIQSRERVVRGRKIK